MIENGILYVTAYLGQPHGTAKSARDFLRALLACCPEVSVASPFKEDMAGEMCGRPLSTPNWLGGPNGLQNSSRAWRRRIPVLKQWLNSHKRQKFFQRLGNPGLAIINGWASLDYWRQFAGNVRCPKMLIVRESPRHFEGDIPKIEIESMVASLEEFDFLLFVSETCRKEWLAFPRLREKPNFFVANCCEEEETQKLVEEKKSKMRLRLGLQKDEFIITCVGPFSPRKGQDLLFDILPQLAEKIPNVHLLMIGDVQSDWGRDLLIRTAGSEFANRVTHWPSRPQVLDAIYAADVLALTSRAEAMPRAVLEAMALKTTVIACGVDGVVELLEDGKTGIIIPPDDKSALAMGLIGLSAEPARARKIAEAAYARYWGKFSRQCQFDRVREVLREVQSKIAAL